MNYIIFTAVLTAFLGIGGHQPTNAQFGPEPQGSKGISYNETTHLNSMVLNPWTPLASSRPTPNLATYVIPVAMLLYLAVSLIQCNILAKAFCQTVNFYPIVYALNGFEPPNLPSYVTKVLPSILGYYNQQDEDPAWPWAPALLPDHQKQSCCIQACRLAGQVCKCYKGGFNLLHQRRPLTHLKGIAKALGAKAQSFFVIKIYRCVEGLDVQAFWLPPTYLTSSHCPI
ncbi:hypothetical protein DSO57_1003172 [Entomophthora muscae]|uniref:Uncharacterized protein n=1 Tax=Entomophthora muscae TaxID=34485 RepID=A0ACC2SAC2_9FUNG|nr:hypothetical protein DSO57_1003172 [Entomophthora muscae]